MNIFVSSGDVSGDMHAARLAQALKKSDPGVRITALGGDRLKDIADHFLAHLVSLGGFGFWSPFRLYFRLKRLLKDTILPLWDRERPDRVVLVDYYGFNIHLAKEARRRGIPVYYYISPQVWATRPGRIRKLADSVTKMLVILPFEEELYRKAGVDVEFVGHPLLDTVPAPREAPVAGARQVIGLFPGSRKSVFAKHLPLLCTASELIRREIPGVEFRLFALPGLVADPGDLPFPVVYESDYRERMDLTLALTTSGTVSLENALLGIPMIVFYRLSKFNYYLAKLLIRVPYITMANILAGEEIVQEMVQDRSSPESIAAAAIELLRSAERRKEMRSRLLSLRPLLGAPGAAERAAGSILAKYRQQELL